MKKLLVLQGLLVAAVLTVFFGTWQSVNTDLQAPPLTIATMVTATLVTLLTLGALFAVVASNIGFALSSSSAAATLAVIFVGLVTDIREAIMVAGAGAIASLVMMFISAKEYGGTSKRAVALTSGIVLLIIFAPLYLASRQ